MRGKRKKIGMYHFPELKMRMSFTTFTIFLSHVSLVLYYLPKNVKILVTVRKFDDKISVDALEH